jgi:hypothetical protein
LECEPPITVLLQIIGIVIKSLQEYSYLCNYTEDFVDERDLSHDIPLFDTFDLTFADHIHRFIASDCSSSSIERAKSQPRIGQSLDKPVVLLDAVVQIFNLP